MSATDQPPGPEWLASGDPKNPFAFEVLDCRSIALNMMSSTRDPQVAANFLGLRHSKASDLAGERPAEPMAVSCNFSIACNGPLVDGPIFVAPEMEHKWDLFMHDGRVYARRSWTGNVVHVADAAWMRAGKFSVRTLQSDAGSVFGSPEFAKAQLHFLLRTYLERRLSPFPVPPPQARDEASNIAWGGWSHYGRVAMFGCLLDVYPIAE